MESEQFTPSNENLSCGELVLDLQAKTIVLAGESITLTPLEFSVLVYLASCQMRPVPAEELLEAVWGCAEGGTINQVTCCIKRLRKKLTIEGVPQYLRTQRGFGFRLCDPPPNGEVDEAKLTLFDPILTKN